MQAHDKAEASPEEESSIPSEQEESTVSILASGAWKLGTAGPRLALRMTQYGMQQAERVALQSLRKRLDAVKEAADEFSGGVAGASSESEFSGVPSTRPAQEMHRLLKIAEVQTPDQAQERLLLNTIRALVPDEARILAYLANGNSCALLHLASGPKVGPATRRWMDNLSNLGHEAKVTLRDQTSNYISHLRDLGLLESDQEDKSFSAVYEKLEVETEVRKAITAIEKDGHRARFFRRTIRLSERGQAFCSCCFPEINTTKRID